MLAEYATKNQPDLILIATHGRSGPSRWVWEAWLIGCARPHVSGSHGAGSRLLSWHLGKRVQENEKGESAIRVRAQQRPQPNGRGMGQSPLWEPSPWDWLEAESAGLEAGKLNPLVIQVMKKSESISLVKDTIGF